ncbi:hypothetical protein [Hoeflea marina]|nr:hypothetical protein [Hoeflea marina]
MGWTATACFVFDGATGLGGDRLTAHPGSDAAWLSEMARNRFAALCSSGQYTTDIIRKVNTDVRAFLDAETDAAAAVVEDWRYPVAGYEMLRLVGDRLEISGLGDCVLHLVNADGAVFSHTPLPEFSDAEQISARAAIARAGGLKRLPSMLHDEAEQERMRMFRAGYNKPGSPVWTLGRNPDAADHASFARVPPEFLDGRPLQGLLMSDGFSALADRYAAYTAVGLVAAARQRGLAALCTELRGIEAEDADGHQFPRFKQSDDATAILFSVS